MESRHDVLCAETAPDTPDIQGMFLLLPPAPLHYPFSREKSMLRATHDVSLWADMNAATPLGAWGRSVVSTGNGVTAPLCFMLRFGKGRTMNDLNQVMNK